MVASRVDRRRLLAGLGAVALAPQMVVAEDFIALRWKDLMPEGAVFIPPILRDAIDHDQPPLFNQQPASSGVRHEWTGQTVRLPGFIVPIDYSGTGVTAFILVPFVGACVHVPPPPANQLVFVTTEKPYENTGLFEAVQVTGVLSVATMSTYLADVGYGLTADRIERFEA